MATYKWAIGWDIALVDLINVSDDLYPYTRPRRFAPTAQPIEPLPVRAVPLSGGELGEGTLTGAWELTGVSVAGFAWLITNKWTVGGLRVASRKMTIYTPNDVMAFTRYNVYAMKPIAGREYRHRQDMILDILIRFEIEDAL